MLQDNFSWIMENWAELTSIIIASVALFYAARAYHSSKAAANATRKSDHTNLKVSAKAGLAETHRSFNLLQSNCQQKTTAWEQYTRKHLPVLSAPSAQPIGEISRISSVRREGAALLNNLGPLCARSGHLTLSLRNYGRLWAPKVGNADKPAVRIKSKCGVNGS